MRIPAVAAILLTALLAGCASPADRTMHIAATDPTAMQPLAAWIEEQLGRPVELVPVDSAADGVAMFLARQVHTVLAPATLAAAAWDAQGIDVAAVRVAADNRTMQTATWWSTRGPDGPAPGHGGLCVADPGAAALLAAHLVAEGAPAGPVSDVLAGRFGTASGCDGAAAWVGVATPPAGSMRVMDLGHVPTDAWLAGRDLGPAYRVALVESLLDPLAPDLGEWRVVDADKHLEDFFLGTEAVLPPVPVLTNG